MIVSKARSLLCALLALSSASLCAQDWTHYDRDPGFKPATLPNGAVSNISAWQKVHSHLRVGEGVEAKAVPVTKNTWVITGYFYGPVIVETDSGLLVFSSGENTDDGTKFRQIIREQISKKPIIALFYDHAHYAKGATTLLDGDKAMIVAHPNSNRILADSGSLANPYIPELLPTLDGRAAIHFGSHHPASGPDAKMAGASLQLGRQSGWMPATKTLADGETMSVGGVTIQAFHAITDTEDSLTFWLPDRKLVIDNVLWPIVPNLYTLRGDRYRDPQDWMKALRKIRDLKPEVEICVGGGSLALVGQDKILEASNALLDSVAFIYDQSIRLTNQGVPADELGNRIHMPDSLLKHPYVNELYGQFETWPEAVAQRSHGWFSGYAEDIHNLPRKVYAENFIKLAGGADKVQQAYNEAMGKGEYLWAKDLASELYYSARDNAQYRENLATVFRKLGQYSPGSIVRNFYTAAAMSLEGNQEFSLGIVQPATWVKHDLKRAVSALRTRINPEQAKGLEGVLSLDIDGQVSALHIRNSVAEFVAEPATHYRASDATIKVDSDTFTAYFRGELSASELLAKATSSGNSAQLLGLFDAYKQQQMYPTTDL
ncbi:hypothetical protein JQX08_14140 [Pseudomonas sp. UL073]|uniref:Alkyl sulfatase dimerisation domain-containing protein n=1 Tax=Zestomonas insulae TaxID=2809017 RepID=A0ABS2IFH8_9GAMM|nr:alkyl sulfatase dimerization domain-containing protein [Pseudomonas insulae]MBM7061846.1 hypothetical protein [Pseudomonas insulae]